MKQILIVAMVFFTLNAFGQINNLKVPLVKSTDAQIVSQNDTVLKVYWVCSNNSERNPAYYLNGQLVNETILKTLNPNVIDKIRVEKQEIIVEKQKYYGQIFIDMKGNYSPKLVSLKDLKSKYTNLKDAPTIFMINNEIINGNYDKCIVDENYLLRISIEKIENEKLHLYFIQILTMSEENIKKSKEIRIRGLQLRQTE